MIELRQLGYVVAVAEERHFGRAARRLGMAQSPLSQAIAKLERTLEVRLLERSSRHVDLTASGAAFLVAARETLAEAEGALRAVNASAAREVVPVRMAGTPITRQSIVPAVTAELALGAPELEVEAIEMSQHALFAALAGRSADVGFAVHPDAPPGLAVELIRLEPAVVLVGRRNPLRNRRRVSLARLGDQPLAIWPRQIAPGFHDRVLAVLEAAGVEPRLVVHPSAGADWSGQFVDEGFTLVPRGAPEIPDAVRLPVADAPTFASSLLWRRGDDRPLVAAVLQASRACARARGWLAADKTVG